MEYEDILKIIEENKKLLDHLKENFPIIKSIGEICSETIKNGGKIIVIGNGGSAAQAQHFSCELIVKMDREREAMPCIALTSDSSIITAISNDKDFKYVFSRQIEGLGKKGDVLFILSTSGNSENLIESAKKAKMKGIKILSLLGKDGGKVKELSDIKYIVPSVNTQRIQEIHNLILHIIVQVIEDEFFRN